MAYSPDFNGTMRSLFLHGHYSDMKIICQGYTFKVHRNIVCSQSHFFRGAVDGQFQEAENNTINLPEDDPETIERVLSFLYLEKYEDVGHILPLDVIESKPAQQGSATASSNASNNTEPTTDARSMNSSQSATVSNGVSSSPDDMRLDEEKTVNTPETAGEEGEEKDGDDDNDDNDDEEEEEGEEGQSQEDLDVIASVANANIDVYVAADKFGILPLKSVAKKAFSSWVEKHWNLAVFPDVVRKALVTAPPHEERTGLRRIVVNIISKHATVLLKKKKMIRVVEDFGSLGSAVLLNLVQCGLVVKSKKEQEGALHKIALKLNTKDKCDYCRRAFNLLMKNDYRNGEICCAYCKTGL